MAEVRTVTTLEDILDDYLQSPTAIARQGEVAVMPDRGVLHKRPDEESWLAVQALENAVARRRVEGADAAGRIVLSERGGKSRSWRFLAAPRSHDLVGSIGQVVSAASSGSDD